MDGLCLTPGIFQNLEIEEMRKKLVKATRELPLSVREMIVVVECKVMQGIQAKTARFLLRLKGDETGCLWDLMIV